MDITVNNLSHVYSDGSPGLQDISLHIAGGEFVILTGANGSGKTTLLRHLNGLLLPTAGEVRVDGVSVSRDLLRARQKVGMVFQDADSQIVGETVFDEVAFGPENLCLPRDEVRRRTTSALAAVGLLQAAQKAPHLLSGGEKRRLAIGGILAMGAPAIILDEPFSNLDYSGVQQVLQQLAALHAKGRTIIVATHDLEKVLALADRLLVLAAGHLILDGAPLEVVKQVEDHGVREPHWSRIGARAVSWLN